MRRYFVWETGDKVKIGSKKYQKESNLMLIVFWRN